VAVAQLVVVRRMSASLLASEFPEDPIGVLRAGWQYLATYYAIAGVVVFLAWKLIKASRFTYSTIGRSIIAAILAIIFTPSEVSDFFLFNLPGPAVLGLTFLLIALPSAQQTSPSGPPPFLDWHIWAVIVGYYILPILVTFALAYAALSAYARSHRPVTLNA
jgi:hypothetical protein